MAGRWQSRLRAQRLRLRSHRAQRVPSALEQLPQPTHQSLLLQEATLVVPKSKQYLPPKQPAAAVGSGSLGIGSGGGGRAEWRRQP